METPVICRLTRQVLGIGFFFGAMLLGLPIMLYFDPKTTTGLIDLQITAICCISLPVIPAIWFYIRCRLIANQQGLEIRGLLYRRVIPWDQIRDFYFQLPEPDKKMKMKLIYVEYGTRKQQLSRNYENLPALMEAIETRATSARARKFEIRETRNLGETPEVFDYGNPQIWPTILIAIGAGPAFFGLSILKSASYSGFRGISNPFALFSGPMQLLFIATAVCIFSLPSLMILATLPMTRNLQKFRGQQIIASKSGLEWRKGADKIEIPWTQIRTYYAESLKGHLQPDLCIVESEREKISFLHNMPKAYILKSIIIENAKNANVDSWQYTQGNDSDVLGSDSTAYAEGKRIFHYKTRTNRAGLILGLFMIFSLFLTNYFRNLTGQPTDFMFWLFLTVIGTPTIYGGLAYFFSRVQIEPEGIRHITLFKQNFIQWNEIQKLKITSLYWIIGNDKTLRISPYIAERAQFITTVAERSGKTWEKPEEKAEFLIGH